MRVGPLLALPPIVLGIAAAAWLIAGAPGPAKTDSDAPALSVRIETVTPQTIRPAASVWGNLRAADTWVAVAEVQGEVIWRHPDLEQGRIISAETEVLRIDPSDYELSLRQAEADLAAGVGGEVEVGHLVGRDGDGAVLLVGEAEEALVLAEVVVDHQA